MIIETGCSWGQRPGQSEERYGAVTDKTTGIYPSDDRPTVILPYGPSGFDARTFDQAQVARFPQQRTDMYRFFHKPCLRRLFLSPAIPLALGLCRTRLPFLELVPVSVVHYLELLRQAKESRLVFDSWWVWSMAAFLVRSFNPSSTLCWTHERL